MKVGLLGGMFLIFLTLKLTGVIAWSWWWVTAPLWGLFALLVVVPLAVFLTVCSLVLFVNTVSYFKDKLKKKEK
jgi:hypothetical protein